MQIFYFRSFTISVAPAQFEGDLNSVFIQYNGNTGAAITLRTRAPITQKNALVCLIHVLKVAIDVRFRDERAYYATYTRTSYPHALDMARVLPLLLPWSVAERMLHTAITHFTEAYGEFEPAPARLEGFSIACDQFATT